MSENTEVNFENPREIAQYRKNLRNYVYTRDKGILSRKIKQKPLPTVDEIEEPAYVKSREQAQRDENRKNKFVSIVHAEQWWVEQAYNNPVAFMEYVSGLTPAKHHRIWLANMFHPERKRINIIAPRESAKSTVTVYGMLWYISRNPLSSNGIVSVSASQAEDRLRMIKLTIMDNVRYRNVFPYIHIDDRAGVPNTQNQFTVKSTKDGMDYRIWRFYVEKFGSSKDPTLVAAGRGSRSLIGRRYSGILLLDDIIDQEDLSDYQQEKVMRYIMQSLIPCVKEEGRVFCIGTRWMVNDVPEQLSKNPQWHTIQIDALKRDPVTGELKSYWPEYWPVERLEQRRQEMQNDALFEIQYLNNPQAMTSSLFSLADLSHDIPRPLPDFKFVYITTDQAISMSARADFNVYMCVGIDRYDNYYILDMVRFKGDVEQQIQILSSFYDKSVELYKKVNAVLFEKVAMQGIFSNLLNKMRPDIPTDKFAPKGDKSIRANLVARYAKAGKLFINQQLPDLSTLISEWINFPLAKHDDTLDPLGLLMQYTSATVSVKKLHFIRSPHLL